jgi:hypothetical protein
MARDTELVKIGQSSAQYTATSALDDNSGWSARGRRFAEPLDLTAFRGLGVWVHGDGKGESLKLQFRDTEGAWHDMVRRIDFTGWRYVEFNLEGANLDLGRIEYLIIYYNGIPAGQTVTCRIDDVRALRQTRGIARPELSVAGKTIVFPVELGVGDRLVMTGPDDCRLYRKAGDAPEAVRPEGKALNLKRGRNRVVLRLPPGSPEDMRMSVSLMKTYR